MVFVSQNGTAPAVADTEEEVLVASINNMS